MKRKLSLILFYILIAFSPSYAINMDSIYNALDIAIKDANIYDSRREAKINIIKKQLHDTGGDYAKTFYLNEKLADAYKAYRYDFIAKYLNQNLILAQRHNDTYGLDKTRLKLAYVFASAGMYLEAVNLIKMINRRTLDSRLIIDYYNTCNRVYGEESHQTQDAYTNRYYSRLALNYQDSLLMILPHNSLLYFSFKETEACQKGNYDKALEYNTLQLRIVKPETPEYSIVCYFRSVDYSKMDNTPMEKYWLGLSAISDIKQAIKDQASLWTLANILAQEGNVERSYSYIRFSWIAAQTYDVPLRKLQNSTILSVVDHNYQVMIEKQNTQLRHYSLIISALTILLIITMVYIYIQMRHLSITRNNLHIANNNLTELNDKLEKTNESLHKANEQLLDSNKIKEVYIGRFLTLCSFYIDKLENFRNTIFKKAKVGKLTDYLTSDKIQNLREQDVIDLMHNFDHAFLCLFPNFVEEFNKMLKPESRIYPENGELLNTKLRIFALIRLGIDDSSKIAEFLHYSANTIYNYRAEVKNLAIVSRDEFEKHVKEIGR